MLQVAKKIFQKKFKKKIIKSIKSEQDKYNIFIGGGDTVKSKHLSFSITVVGYSDKIIYRNKSNIDDDIYVTGCLGDSYIGLRSLQKKNNSR